MLLRVLAIHLESDSFRSKGLASRNRQNSYNSHMKTISALDAKNRFGQLLEAAQREPITVTKQGRPAAIMLSVEDFERIRGASQERLLQTIREVQAKAAAAGLTQSELDKLL